MGTEAKSGIVTYVTKAVQQVQAAEPRLTPRLFMGVYRL